MNEQRPLLLRLLPLEIRGSVWSRLYRPTAARFHAIFADSELHFAPHIHMQLLPGDVISDSIAFTGLYDLPLTRRLLRLARQGGRMVDVGANLGYFSLLWAAANPGNSVVAFEAAPRNVEFLRLNIARNQLQRQIELRSEAVGKENGEMDFDVGPADQTGWGGLSLRRTSRTCRVPVVRLDDALRGVDHISLLKIDIEGADTWALLGAEGLLRERRVRHIWWEQHRPRIRELGIAEAQAAAFLRDLDYQPMPQGDPHADVANWHATLR